jgi:hypothetical protein
VTATLNHHDAELPVDVPPAVLVALLEVRPRPWLGGFLRIAALTATADLPAVERVPGWFRTGFVIAAESGGAAVPIVWSPNVGDEVFASFSGQLVVRPSTDGSVIAFEGGTTGGSAARNSRVLRRLLQLIASAIRPDHRPAGSMSPSRTAVATASNFECAPNLISTDCT